MEKLKTQNTFVVSALRLLARLWVTVTAVIGSLVVLGIILIIAALRSSSGETQPVTITQKVLEQGSEQKIAVVNLNGVIVDAESEAGFGETSGVIAAKRVNLLLDHLAKDQSVKAVVLRINSPGGSAVPADEIYRKVRELQQQKIVVASLGSTAASGGYYIAAGTNKIVANPATITGSIGVIAQLPNVSGLFEKVGIEIQVIKTGQYKDIGSPNRNITPEERRIIESFMDTAFDQFIAAIVTGRHMEEVKVRQLADGRIYSGQQAKDNGLVDELGDFSTAINSAQSLAGISNPTVVEYSSQSFLESLLQSATNFSPTLKAVDTLLPQQKFGLYYLMSVGQ